MESLYQEKIKELERKITQLSIIYSAASSISVSSDEKSALENIIDSIMDNLTPEIGIIFLFDEKNEELYPAVSRGIKFESISEERVKIGEYPSGKSFQKGEYLETEIKEIDEIEPFLRRFPIRKVFCTPIKSNRKTIGMLHISKFKNISLTEEEKWLLTIFSNRAGVALESSILYRELEEWGKSLDIKVKERTKEIEENLNRIKTFENIALKIGTEMNLSKSLPYIGRKSSKIIGADRWAIFVVSKKYMEIKKFFFHGISENYINEVIKNWEKVEGAKVIFSQKPIFIKDVFEIENPYAKELARLAGYRGLFLIPCNYHGKIIGIIVYYKNSKWEFSEIDKEMAISFGNLTAVAIANSELFEEQRKTLRQRKAINRIGRAILSSLKIQKVYEEAVKLVQKIQNYPYVFLLIFDNKSNKLVQVAKAGWLKGKTPDKYIHSPEKGIIGRVFKSGKIYVSGDAKKDPYYLEYFSETNSELAVPIKKGKEGKVLGVIDVQSEELNSFKKEDIETIKTVADQLSMAIENIELYNNLIKSIKELSTLYKISQELSAILNLEELLHRIIINLKSLVPFDSGGILIYNPSLNVLEVKAYLGPKNDSFKGILRVGEGLTGTCFKNRKPIIVGDVRKDRRYVEGVPGALSEIVVPLIFQNETIGVLNLESRNLNAYNEEHLGILKFFASLISLSIRNAMLFEELKRESEEFKILSEIGSVSISTLELKKLYKIISQKIMEIFNVDTYYLSIFNPEKGELSFPIFLDRGKPLKLKPIRIEEASGLTGWIVKNKKPIMFLDYEKEKEALSVKPLIIIKASQSYIGIPIIYKEKVLGVISIQSYKKNAFTQRDFYLLKIIANQIALAIENARLFNEVKTALLKLKDSQKKLIKTEKMRFLGTLSAGIAHQFNNILSAILARAQILSSKTEDPEIRRGLEIIEKASLGGADIVRRILEFSKLEQKEKGEPVNLYQIVEDAINLTEVKWKNEAERKGIKIEIIKEVDKSIFVKGNSSELREALLNVISNSIEALEHDGFIHIRSELMKNKVLLEIKDNGIGISQSDIERVFEPFFTTKGITGTGLGLSFVYGVVKKYKGDIKIESERGKGTTVKIYLIKAKYPKLEIKGETRIKEEKLPLKILVIEDEEYVLDLIVEILKNDGHYVSYARSGDDGLKKFEMERFDLVITDLGMPGISGWEVMERIRIKNSEVRIGVITGWNIRGEVERLRELGVEFVITKPFGVEHLKLATNKERNGKIFLN